MEFRVGGTCFSSHLNGHHNALNLLAGIATAQAFGIELEQLVKPVRTFLPGQMRSERSTYKGIVIWNDCYNSNPEAARAMLDVLRNTTARRRIAVLGEMRELGQQSKELHREVGRHAAKLGIDVLIGVAGDANKMTAAAQESGLRQVAFYEDAAEAGVFAREFAMAGDAILFKGSRGVGMERALDAFVNNEIGRAHV